MSSEYTAQDYWKDCYADFKNGYRALSITARNDMIDIRREAALERIIARQAREIDALKSRLKNESSDSAYWFDKWAELVK